MPSDATYPFEEIETVWAERWRERDLFRAVPRPGHPRFYVYEYPPYPNGSLHIGHVRNYTVGDATARYRRSRGDDVLYTQGFDSFGLPNEIAAREQGCHPREITERSIETISRQFDRFGLSYDRKRIVRYHDPSYYVWTQRIFLILLEAGLAYREEAGVNWCEACQTTLADDQAIDGNCWRCGSGIETRWMPQWFLRMTRYADALERNLDQLDAWPDMAKAVQRRWVGRAEGIDMRFEVTEMPGDEIWAFSTQPELIHAMNFLALSLDHPFLRRLEAEGRLEASVAAEVDALRRAEIVAKRNPTAGKVERPPARAVRTGLHVSHPLTGDALPLLAGNYVSMAFGTGAATGAPTHDRKDAAVAATADVGGRRSLTPPRGAEPESLFDYEDDWTLVDAGALSGSTVAEARETVPRLLEEADGGGPAVRHRLRDWLISRQRYWGVPVPVVHCGACGIVPVPEADLPVELPEDVDLSRPGNPLEAHESFLSVDCPRCGESARRETDTMDTFVNCVWFPYRYCVDADEAFDFAHPEVRHWMPADLTVGGTDILCGALFHERFLAHAFQEIGLLDHDEPARMCIAHEMVIRDGRKMSKSLGNTVDPDELISRFGADSLRLAILFIGPLHKKIDWNERKLRDAHRFLAGVFELSGRLAGSLAVPPSPLDPADEAARELHRITAQVTEAFDRYRFNVAIHALMALRRHVEAWIEEAASDADRARCAEGASRLVRMLSPIAPHLAEAAWERLGGTGFCSRADWPEADPSFLERSTRTLVVQVDGEVVGRVELDPAAGEAEAVRRGNDVAEDSEVPAALGFQRDAAVGHHYVRGRRNDVINFVTRTKGR